VTTKPSFRKAKLRSDIVYKPYGKGFRAFQGERLCGLILPASYEVRSPTGTWLRNAHSLNEAKQILETWDAEMMARIAAEGKCE
jgi:hypothetical protein